MRVFRLSPRKPSFQTEAAKVASLLQLINRIRQCLLIRLHIAPDITVALMPGGLASVVHSLGLSELAQEGMAQHVGGYINFFFLGEMGIGLGGNTEDDTIRFT